MNRHDFLRGALATLLSALAWPVAKVFARSPNPVLLLPEFKPIYIGKCSVEILSGTVLEMVADPNELHPKPGDRVMVAWDFEAGGYVPIAVSC